MLYSTPLRAWTLILRAPLSPVGGRDELYDQQMDWIGFAYPVHLLVLGGPTITPNPNKWTD